MRIDLSGNLLSKNEVLLFSKSPFIKNLRYIGMRKCGITENKIEIRNMIKD